MEWLARPPDMNPIEHVYREESRPLVFNVGRGKVLNVSCSEHDFSCGHPEVDSELPVTLHGSYMVAHR